MEEELLYLPIVKASTTKEIAKLSSVSKIGH